MTNNQQPKEFNPDNIATGGGAFIAGDAETETLIGRDSIVIEGDYIDQRSLPQETVVTPEDPTPGDPPYMGLPFFTKNDAHLFFGRTALIEELVQLVTEIGQRDSRFLAIVGASGSGKSSLVRAGLVPALEADRLLGSADWPIHIVRPKDHPLENLAASLTKTNESVSAMETLVGDRA